MGLRGLTVVFSSGDDGIGNFIVRTNPTLGCSKAFPSWPAASPYVTTIGATQLTNEYLPICENNYGVSTSYPYLPTDMKLQFQVSSNYYANWLQAIVGLTCNLLALLR